VRAPDGLDAGLGQAEVLDLPIGDELLDGAGDVLDRGLRVDPVLSTARRIDSGRLDSPVDLPSSSNAKPNLVAMTTWSRTGRSASPTSSSLT
jgi:hypothetical protein